MGGDGVGLRGGGGPSSSWPVSAGGAGPSSPPTSLVAGEAWGALRFFTSHRDARRSEAALLLHGGVDVASRDVALKSGWTGLRLHPWGSLPPLLRRPRGAESLNTLSLVAEDSEEVPLVVTHGYAAGLGFFYRNYGAMTEGHEGIMGRRTVHAVDLLGFGLSSRPHFAPKTTEEAEGFFLDSLEAWRESMGLGRFVLLGHSMGGYLATLYAQRHPERVAGLVLVDPAGLRHEADPDGYVQRSRFWREDDKWKQWKIGAMQYLWHNTTPMAFMRLMGPLGKPAIHNMVDFRWGRMMNGVSESECKAIAEYLYHTWAADPSAEKCVSLIFAPGALARHAVEHRMDRVKCPVAFIYGEKSWISWKESERIRAEKLSHVPTTGCLVPHAGHQVFIENAEGFNEALRRALSDMRPHLGLHLDEKSAPKEALDVRALGRVEADATPGGSAFNPRF